MEIVKQNPVGKGIVAKVTMLTTTPDGWIVLLLAGALFCLIIVAEGMIVGETDVRTFFMAFGLGLVLIAVMTYALHYWLGSGNANINA